TRRRICTIINGDGTDPTPGTTEVTCADLDLVIGSDGAALTIEASGEHQYLENEKLAKLIASDGPIHAAPGSTVVFKNFSMGKITSIDWSVVNKAIFFDNIHFVTSDRHPPYGTRHFRHVQFPHGVGIVDSRIEGDFRIEHARFGAFVEIRQTEVTGRTDLESVRMDGAVLVEENIFRRPVRIENVRFEASLNLIDNRFHPPPDIRAGREFDGTSESLFRIRESHIVDSFTIKDNVFLSDSSNDWRSFYGQKLMIDGANVLIDNNVFLSHFSFFDSKLNRLGVSNNIFRSFSGFNNNSFFNVNFFNNFHHQTFKFSKNSVETYFWIDRDIYGHYFRSFEASGNLVKNDVWFTPYNLPPNLSEKDDENKALLDFTYNHFQGPVDIVLPRIRKTDPAGRESKDPELLVPVKCTMGEEPYDWRGDSSSWPGRIWDGTVTLAGSTIDTQLNITDSCHFSRKYQMQPFGREYPSFQIYDLEKMEKHPSLCSDEEKRKNKLRMNFSQLNVDTLNIALPMSGCEWQWIGKELIFRNLGDVYGFASPQGVPASSGEPRKDPDGNPISSGDTENLQKFVGAWRRLLTNEGGERGEKSTLKSLSDYLFEINEPFEARDYLQDANELTYSPECFQTPLFNFRNDCLSSISKQTVDDMTIKQIREAIAALSPSEIFIYSWNEIKIIGQWLRYIALLPAGFGANPQYALALDFGVFIVLLVVLYVYTSGWFFILWNFGRDQTGKLPGGGMPGARSEEPKHGPRPATDIRSFGEWRRQREYLRTCPIGELNDGWTRQQGFRAIDPGKYGRRFSLFGYALDACIPAISL
ncbi:MAG: hypothetical protein KDH19_20575, partial [Geminicoccaceae bacterium]|nr:hypothetical protein [Geminicoccaceae bacterium]